MNLHLSELTNGSRIRVTKTFVDFDRNQINAGTMWTYWSHDYFIHDGGYTFHFAEGNIRLAEVIESNDYVLTHFSEFFEILEY